MGQDTDNDEVPFDVTVFEQVLKSAGANIDDPGYQTCSNLDYFSNGKEVAQKLGKAFHDYFVATIYDMSFEGYTKEQVETLEQFMKDFSIFVQNM